MLLLVWALLLQLLVLPRSCQIFGSKSTVRDFYVCSPPEEKGQPVPIFTGSQCTRGALPHSAAVAQVMNSLILSSLLITEVQKSWSVADSTELTLPSGPSFCKCAGQITSWLTRFVHSFAVLVPDSDLMFYSQWQTIANS